MKGLALNLQNLHPISLFRPGAIRWGSPMGGLLLVVGWLAAGVAGCGKSGPQTVSVTGTVTYQGKPVSNGTVSFLPVDPQKGRSAMGKIDPNGRYVAMTSETIKGLLPGEYIVTVSAFKTPIADLSPAKSASADNLAVPARYTDPKTSPLKLTVAAGDRSKTFDIPLEEK